jgi:hypothetical protein
MAFVRWKKSPSGTWKAYLVHSYRDEQGRVRHKHLAYLGHDPQLTPERLDALKARHGHDQYKWHAIKPPASPKRINISQMTDEEIIQNLRRIRREHGLTFIQMASRLAAAGAPPPSHGRGSLGWIDYRWIEQAVESIRGKTHQNVYKDLPRELAPAVRKSFCSA